MQQFASGHLGHRIELFCPFLSDNKKFLTMRRLSLIKCLEKVLSTPTISTEGLKEANAIMKKLEQKLRVEYKVLIGRVGENLDTAEAKAEKERTGKFMFSMTCFKSY